MRNRVGPHGLSVVRTSRKTGERSPRPCQATICARPNGAYQTVVGVRVAVDDRSPIERPQH
jgi:hypothetical protein